MTIRASFIAAAAISVLVVGARAQPPATFTFGAAGDFTRGPNFQATAAAVKARNPDFMLGLGDYSYEDDGEEPWCKYWTSQDGLNYKNLILVAGNHDTDESLGGDIPEYIKYCGQPFKTVGVYGRQFYFDYPFDAPLVRFIMISPGVKGDTGMLDPDYKAGSAGFKFTAGAIDDARKRGIKWIVVGMHKNYISTLKKSNEISEDAGNTFMTMLFDKRVDLILQGHEHGYERSKQLATNTSTCRVLRPNEFNPACVADSDDAFVKGAGTVIDVLGTGGKDLRVLQEDDTERPYFVERFLHADNKAFGFGLFTVSATRLTYEFVKSAGVTFTDTFTITESGSN
ncbi:MAG TPA: metallophosphoesterase [Vicinamibacterales bacterium]|jgi:hypothetical protein